MSDLGELFARDPRNLTTDDIAVIVKRMREAQAQFELGIKTSVAERPRKNKTKSEDFKMDIEALLGGVDLKKLGIGD
jgi:hypothetical protein